MFRSKRYHLFVYLQFTYRRKVLVSRLLPPIRSAMMRASKRHQRYYFLVRSYAWRQVASSSSDCPRYVRGTHFATMGTFLSVESNVARGTTILGSFSPWHIFDTRLAKLTRCGSWALRKPCYSAGAHLCGQLLLLILWSGVDHPEG